MHSYTSTPFPDGRDPGEDPVPATFTAVCGIVVDGTLCMLPAQHEGECTPSDRRAA